MACCSSGVREAAPVGVGTATPALLRAPGLLQHALPPPSCLQSFSPPLAWAAASFMKAAQGSHPAPSPLGQAQSGPQVQTGHLQHVVLPTTDSSCVGGVVASAAAAAAAVGAAAAASFMKAAHGSHPAPSPLGQAQSGPQVQTGHLQHVVLPTTGSSVDDITQQRSQRPQLCRSQGRSQGLSL